MSFRPHIFGRYTILDPIAVGGMAEIYRARLSDVGDAPDRIIIIKKIIQSLSNNSDFVDMFEAEIKITVGLSHPNIVQIFDYGRVEGVSFLAMEYVEGKNLRQFLKRLISMKSMFSIDMSCHIISQVCNAMAYAHAFKDRMSGEHLGIVHRDVSPQNVMISYDGAVKLFDFGIAKAKRASEATQAGVIKGKPSYLSPEQIAGEVLDGRSDVFSLGIVLWEMLTAKRLFVADNDMAILRMIQSAKIESPSTYNPAIPQTLDAITLKSLARDRNKRYRTAEEMQRDLHRFLYSYNPSFNPADLSYYATELFKKEIQEDRDRLRTALKITPDPNPHAKKTGTGTSNTAGATSAVPTTALPTSTAAPANPLEPTSAGTDSKSALTEGLLSSNDFNRQAMEGMLLAKKQKAQPLTEIELAEPGAAKTKNPAKSQTAKRASGRHAVTNNHHSRTKNEAGKGPEQAEKEENLVIPPWSNTGIEPEESSRNTITSLNDVVIPRRKMKSGTSSVRLRDEIDAGGLPRERNSTRLLAAVLIMLMVGLLGTIRFAPETMEPYLKGTPFKILLPEPPLAKVPGPKPSALPQSQADVPAKNEPKNLKNEDVTLPQYAKVRLKTSLKDLTVTINGRNEKPVENVIEVPVGIDVNIEFAQDGYDSKVLSTRLNSIEMREWAIELPRIEHGRLTFMTTPGADITLRAPGRRPLSLYTPLRNYELPTGEYEATIENQRVGHRSTLKFRVERDKLTTVEKDLN